MNLFINAVSTEGSLIFFDDSKNIISSQKIEVAGNESSKLTSLIDAFIGENKIKYSQIKNIVVVSGPGSFTGVRAISLIVNTISFTSGSKITDLSFFDLFDKYPIVKSSSKRDLFVKYSKTDKIEVVKNEDFLSYLKSNNISKLYGDIQEFLLDDGITTSREINYSNIIKNIKYKNKTRVEPLYIKKPSIS